MRIFITILLISLVTAAPAGACDLKNLFFGASAKQIIDQYKLVVEDVEKDGEFFITEMGKVVCDELPEQSMMEFTFIDNSLVKLKIDNKNSSAELLAYGQKEFGESDDKDRKKNSNGKVSVALWNAGEKMSIVYSTHKNARGEISEGLDISSKMHSALFEKIVEQRSKDIDKYLKANSMGKYSSSYQNGTSSSSSSGVNSTGGTYDPNALQDMKNQYDKEHDAWKKKNDANNKGR
jgi:hypothetical protein